MEGAGGTAPPPSPDLLETIACKPAPSTEELQQAYAGFTQLMTKHKTLGSNVETGFLQGSTPPRRVDILLVHGFPVHGTGGGWVGPLYSTTGKGPAASMEVGLAQLAAIQAVGNSALVVGRLDADPTPAHHAAGLAKAGTARRSAQAEYSKAIAGLRPRVLIVSVSLPHNITDIVACEGGRSGAGACPHPQTPTPQTALFLH